VRHILETAVVPRVGFTLDGWPVRGCSHLVGGVPGAEVDRGDGQLGVLDRMCEGRGLMCRSCAERHLPNPATPHRDPRHGICIVCGYHSESGLNLLAATIVLRKPLVVASPELDAISAPTGQPLARAPRRDDLVADCLGVPGARWLPRLEYRAALAAARERPRPDEAREEGQERQGLAGRTQASGSCLPDSWTLSPE
jgi:hypothetical protein